ncbi:TonB-dependent receptor, partial [Mycobacterium tuberculosis]|nr:TonB-dependent receptor [Mycobacterium tuberculosis]
TYADPCAAANNPTGGVLAQCQAQGVPAGLVQPNTDGEPGPLQTAEPFTWQSNPNLKPETSKSTTFGLVWSARWVQGLDVSLYWYKYEISDMIIADSVDRILRDCYVLGNASRCSSVTRAADGHVSAITY